MPASIIHLQITCEIPLGFHFVEFATSRVGAISHNVVETSLRQTESYATMIATYGQLFSTVADGLNNTLKANVRCSSLFLFRTSMRAMQWYIRVGAAFQGGELHCSAWDRQNTVDILVSETTINVEKVRPNVILHMLEDIEVRVCLE